MLASLLAAGIISLIVSLATLFVSLQLLRNSLNRQQAAQKAWERAQEMHRQQWEVQQHTFFGQQQSLAIELEQRLSQELEKQLLAEIEQLYAELQTKDTKEAESAKALIEYELARLPRIEDTPLPSEGKGQHYLPEPQWQLPSLQGADLSGRDFSKRYMAGADLRGAQLVNTNFFMADLSGALLAGANLTGADLSAANLTEADLRDALLNEANFLLTDLNNAILLNAHLLHARNLTSDQVLTTVYNGETEFDPDLDITRVRLAAVRVPTPQPPTPSQEQTASAESMTQQIPSSADQPPSDTATTTPDETAVPISTQTTVESPSSPSIPVETEVGSISSQQQPPSVTSSQPVLSNTNSSALIPPEDVANDSSTPEELPLQELPAAPTHEAPSAPLQEQLAASELSPAPSQEEASTRGTEEAPTTPPQAATTSEAEDVVEEDPQPSIPEFANVPFPSEDDIPAIPEFVSILLASQNETDDIAKTAETTTSANAEESQHHNGLQTHLVDQPTPPEKPNDETSPAPQAVQDTANQHIQFATVSEFQSALIQFAPSQNTVASDLPPQEDFPDTSFFAHLGQTPSASSQHTPEQSPPAEQATDLSKEQDAKEGEITRIVTPKRKQNNRKRAKAD